MPASMSFMTYLWKCTLHVYLLRRLNMGDIAAQAQQNRLRVVSAAERAVFLRFIVLQLQIQHRELFAENMEVTSEITTSAEMKHQKLNRNIGEEDVVLETETYESKVIFFIVLNHIHPYYFCDRFSYFCLDL
uniref:HECT domain-containing protein n=1 Tax=Heterorhabditis bacteriophora TaxID=37862 RepID=A0A1I7X4T5_HETBA